MRARYAAAIFAMVLGAVALSFPAFAQQKTAKACADASRFSMSRTRWSKRSHRLRRACI